MKKIYLLLIILFLVSLSSYAKYQDVTIGGVVFIDADGDNCYDVSSKQHLIAMSMNPTALDNKSFEQTVDIVFNPDPALEDWNNDGVPDGEGTKGFNPISLTIYNSQDLSDQTCNHTIIGGYNGNCYLIKNLYINRPTQDNVGLFAELYNLRKVIFISLDDYLLPSNNYNQLSYINLVDCNITGNNNVGGLVGHAQRMIVKECQISGHVKGNKTVGGVFGGIKVCHAISCCVSGMISAITQVGGIAGASEYWGSTNFVSHPCKVLSCNVKAVVIGQSKVGAIIGLSDYCSICSSLSTGYTSSDNQKGKLFLYDDLPALLKFKNCYFDNQVTQIENFIGEGYSSTSLLTNDFNTNNIEMPYGNSSSAPWVKTTNGRPYLYIQKVSVDNSVVDENGTIKGHININSNANITIAETGVMYRLTNVSSPWNQVVFDGIDSIDGAIDSLITGNTYYVCAYAKDQNGTRYYGDMVKWEEKKVIYHENKEDQLSVKEILVPLGSFVFPEYTIFDNKGYSISEWSTVAQGAFGVSYFDGDSFLIENDEHHLYARWKLNNYTINYQANGGVGTMPYQEFNYNANVSLLSNTFSKIGYKVSGWNTKADGSGAEFNNQHTFLMPDSAITLYAQWEIDGHYITFFPNGGLGSSSSILLGTGIDTTLTTNPFSKNGYTFIGWNTQADGLGLSFADNDAITMGDSDINMYAQWVALSYKVNFNSNGGSGFMLSQNTIYGSELILSKSLFSRQGYKFKEWNTAVNGLGQRYTDEEKITFGIGDVTLFAQWNVDNHNITFFPNGGQGTTIPIILRNGMDTVLTINPFSKNGYKFIGWNVQADGLGLSFADGDRITMGDSDINLYAQWVALNYKVNFYSHGGSGFMLSQNTTYGDEIILSKNSFSRLGYIFKDWNTDVEGLGQRYTDEGGFTTGAGDKTLYAQWTALPYSITYENCELASNVNPTSYTIETPDVVLSHAIQRGKAFNGWFLDSLFANPIVQLPQGSTGDITLYASWSTEYNVVYFSNGGTGQTNIKKLTAVGTDYTTKNNIFSRTGYVFDKWNTHPDGTGTSYNEDQNITLDDNIDFVLYAIWKPLIYSIEYENKEEADNQNLKTYTPKTSTFILEDLNRKGYTFKGWYADSTIRTQVRFIPQGSIGDTLLYANWEINHYAIKYYSNGGKENTIINSFSYGTDTSLLASPFSRKGYHFTGWNSTPAGSGTSYADKDNILIIDKDVILYAQWEMENYSISYHNLLASLNINPRSYTVYTPTVELKPLSKVGYTFGGWFLDSLFQNQSFNIFLGDTGNVNLYALWEVNTYAINYYANGATGFMLQDNIDYGTDTILAANSFTKKGYQFSHWNTKSDDSGENFTEGQNVNMGANDVTLYAQWDLLTYGIGFRNTQGAVNTNPSTFTVLSTFALTALTKEGYTFKGWFADEQYLSAIDMVNLGDTGNITLYAQWELNNYAIIYQANEGDGIISSQSIPFGADTTLKSNSFTKKGYQFSHWNTKKDDSGENFTEGQNVNMGANDVTLYAQWDVLTYDIGFRNTQGAVNTNPSNYTVLSTFALAALIKEGYTFKGWYVDEQYLSAMDMVNLGDTGNITLYAQWELNNYAIIYQANEGDGIISSQSIPFGADTTLKSNSFTKKGYLFSHWNTKSDDSGENFTEGQNVNMGANNVTLYAQWDLVEYTMSYHNLAGAENTNPSTYNVTNSIPLNNLSREGFDFKGWFLDASFLVKRSQVILGDTGDLNLYGQWDIKKLKAAIGSGESGWIRMGDEENRTINKNVSYNASLSDIYAIADINKIFIEWSDGVKDNPRSINEITTDTTITALWETEVLIFISDTVKVYNGNFQNVSVKLNMNVDYVLEYKQVNDLFFTIQEPLEAGEYDVRVSVGGEGYSGTQMSKMYINKKPLVINAVEKQSKKVGEEDADTLAYTVTGLIDGDVCQGALTRSTGEMPGYYPILLGSFHVVSNRENENITMSNNNYDITYIGTDFFIDSDIEILCKWEYMLIVDNDSNTMASYQWYHDGVAIDGATKQSYYNEQHTLCGVYQCEVTYIGYSAKVMTEPITYDYCTSSISSKSLTLYPNPSIKGSTFCIDTEDLEWNEYIIEVFNMQGLMINRLIQNANGVVNVLAPDKNGIYSVLVRKNATLIGQRTLIVQ